MKEISKYPRLRKKLIENSDPELARQMESYMRNKFKFYGLKTPERRKSYHDLIKLEKANKKIDWKFLDQAWADDHREAQYFVCDYLIALEKYLKFEDIDHIFNYVKSKQWWDTIDSLIKPIGNIGLRDDRVNDLMLAWSTPLGSILPSPSGKILAQSIETLIALIWNFLHNSKSSG